MTHKITESELLAENQMLRARIAELEAAQAIQNKQESYLAALHETALTLMSRLELDVLLDTITQRAVALSGTNTGILYLLEPDGQHIRSRAATGMLKRFLNLKVVRGQHLVGQVWDSGQTRIIYDYQHWANRPSERPKESIDAVVAVPLLIEDRVIGVLSVGYTEQGHVFSEDVLQALSGFATLAAIAVYNVSLYEELRESQRFAQSVISALPSLVYIHDIIEGRNVYLSGALYSVLGYSPEQRAQLEGQSVEHLIHPEDVFYFIQMFRDLIRANDDRIVEIEYRGVGVDGNWRWLRTRSLIFKRNEQGKVQQVLGIVEDITPHKHAEDALKESELRFRTLADTAPVMIWMSGLNGGGLFFNRTWLEFTGRTMEAEIIHGWRDGIHPDDYEMMDRLFSAAFDARQEHRAEYRLRRADGAYRWILDVAAPRFTPTGEFAGFIGSAIDITERKESEQHAVDLALERERVNLLTSFVRDAGHDLRTPLSTVSTSLYLMERYRDREERYQYHLNMVKQQIAHLDSLIEDMLTMTRLDGGAVLSFKVSDISTLLIEVVDDTKAKASKKDIELILNLLHQPVMISMDRLEIYRAVSQIVDNAVAYTQQGGEVTVSLTLHEDEAVILIQDNGIGISPEDLPHIFERFYRADRARSVSGSGLGLAIAARVIEHHRGHIEVESTLGQGAKFFVCLPLA